MCERKNHERNNHKRKNFIKKNESFKCGNCGENILELKNGSCRNHCPFCFYSKHVDNVPGDRESVCKSLMKPVEYEYNSKKGYMIVHECLSCGKIQKNKTSFDDPIQPDDYDNFLEFVETVNRNK